MNRLLNSLRATLQSRKGQGTIEYAMATIVVVVVLGLILADPNNPLRGAIETAFNAAAAAVTANT